MLITFDTDLIIDNKLNANQFLALYLIKDNEIGLLAKYLKQSETVNEFAKDIDKLIKKGLLLDSRRGMYDFQDLETTNNFIQLISGGDMFQELVLIYPPSVTRPDGKLDYLLTDLSRTRKIYTKLIQNNRALHEHIIKCLEREIEDKEETNSLAYMKRLPKWISERGWESYKEQVRNLQSVNGNSLGYGETIE